MTCIELPEQAFSVKGVAENFLLNHYAVIAGVDEVGRGCLAGPVYAGAAVIDYTKLYQLPEEQQNLVRDSKQLTREQRAIAEPIVKSVCVEWAVGFVSERVIEAKGIVFAIHTSMKLALKQFKTPPGAVLVDGNQTMPRLRIPQYCIVKGDSYVFAISAASILAKEARDRFMRSQHSVFNGYGFDQHVGYGTKGHLEAIDRLGICPLHRKTFSPIKEILLS